jgi:hypothetical protein
MVGGGDDTSAGKMGGCDGDKRVKMEREEENAVEREEGTMKREEEICIITLHFLLKIQICPCSLEEITKSPMVLYLCPKFCVCLSFLI